MAAGALMDRGLPHRCEGRYGKKRTLGPLHTLCRALAARPSCHPKANRDIVAWRVATDRVTGRLGSGTSCPGSQARALLTVPALSPYPPPFSFLEDSD